MSSSFCGDVKRKEERMFRFKAHSPIIFLIALISLAAVSSSAAYAQAPERFFDTASAPKDVVRLTVFYPSPGTLRHLLALKTEGFIPIENLEIVGVYHAKERTTDYGESVKFVRDNNLPNIHFHAVTAELDVASLYRRNAASEEFRKIFDLSDGIIFFGGPDMPPAAYGEKTDFRTIVEDPYRHYLELSMIFHLLGGLQDPGFKAFLDDRPDFPVLGICLGMQSLNVGSGGTMVQDLWSEVYGKMSVEEAIALPADQLHKNPYRMIAPQVPNLSPYQPHKLRLLPEGRVWKAMGMATDGNPYVMSSHHQAVDTFGKGLKVIARSMDGRIVESIENENYPHVLGVQFHPEFRKLWDPTPEFRNTPDDKELFSYRKVIEANPPSYEFHKKLWLWFFGAVKDGSGAGKK